MACDNNGSAAMRRAASRNPDLCRMHKIICCAHKIIMSCAGDNMLCAQANKSQARDNLFFYFGSNY